MTELWEHTGEPTDEEIRQWIALDGDLSDHLAIRHICPACGSKKTKWIRQQWCVCYGCESSFTIPVLEGYEDKNFWSQFDGQV